MLQNGRRLTDVEDCMWLEWVGRPYFELLRVSRKQPPLAVINERLTTKEKLKTKAVKAEEKTKKIEKAPTWSVLAPYGGGEKWDWLKKGS